MKKESQANKVYTEIRRQILTNQLNPTTRLKEGYWATKLEVSRISVREALTRLLGEGLVIAGVKGGFFVLDMTAKDVNQIREIRQILELGALEIGIDNFNEQQIQLLETLCDDFSSMVEKGYYSGANEVDLKFHETLIEISGNTRLLRAYHMAHIPLFHMKLGNSRLFLDDYDLTDKEHRAIVKALKANNKEKAKDLLKKHFMRGEDAILNNA